MSSKAAQLVASSYMNSNRSISPNDEINLGGGGGGGTNKYTDVYADSMENNFLNLNQDFFKKTPLFSQNSFYDNESLKSALFDMSSIKQNLVNNEQQQNLVQQRCDSCGIEPLVDGKTLVGCFHSFCQPCLIRSAYNGVIQTEIKGLGYAIITCPICSQETLIPNDGVDSLIPNYSSNSNFPGSASSSSASFDFNNLPFKASHLPSTPSSASSSSSSSTTTNSSPQISNYTKSCPISLDHYNKPKNNFMLEQFNFDQMGSSLDQNKLLKRQLQHQQQQQQNQQYQLQQQSRLFQIENDIQKTFSYYVQLLNERRDSLVKELHAIFQFVLKQNNINKMSGNKSQSVLTPETVDESKKSDNEQNEDSCGDMQLLINNRLMSIEFVANLHSVQDLINQSFGYIRYNNSSSSVESPNNQFKQKKLNNSNYYSDMQDQYTGSNSDFLIEHFVSNLNNSQMMQNQQTGNKQLNSSGSSQSLTSKNQNQKQTNNLNGSNSRATSWSSVVASSSSNARVQSQNQTKNLTPFDQIDENTGASSLCSNNTMLSSSSTLSSSDQHVNFEIAPSSYDESSMSAPSALPAKSQIKRLKMTYSCKFGEFGVTDGQFTEPSGVSIGPNNDIIVADTNSHRIQIFDNEGKFKFKFGECGKREGQLLYPNRVAVVKQTGDIVVTERSPTHQIQIYNQYGQFIRKFGANILQHPRGVCVDSKNRIIVVECKVMRVIIFDLMGNVLHKFNCAKYLEFPNGCCCSNDKEEIFISDNRAHCIKVFNYEGQFLRQIGGEGITNYPIGVGINSNGEVLVADNHNNFNLTVFNQDGQMVTALESKVKHAQCFDVGLMNDGSIVLASKDYRIYVYKYNSQGGSTTTNEPIGSINSSSIYSSTQTSNNNIINSMNAFNNF